MEDEHHGSDPLVGRLFQGYRIEGLLAKGGMGAVYVCRHQELPQLRKVLKVTACELEALDHFASPAARANAERARAFFSERFEREARAVAQLKHRYILPIDGIDTIDGKRCILMPFLDGKSLEQLLQDRGGSLTPHETLHITVQISRALDHAHRRGIVHRDLKPGNVFVVPSEDDELEIRVIDFGIAKQVQQGGPATAWGGPVGTLLFMAVEQFEGTHEATPQSDVYSLAVMIYLMIEGRYPWGEQPSAFSQYRRQLETPPDTASAMPAGWEELVGSALSPDPVQRPRSMQEFVYPLAVALQARSSDNELERKSGLEILRGAARRWASSSPYDETLRHVAPTGAWRAAVSGAWMAASGSWPVAVSGVWPVGSWPGATSGSWPESSAVESASESSAWAAPLSAEPLGATSAPSTSARRIVVWKLVLLGMSVAVLAWFVVYALVRALEVGDA